MARNESSNGILAVVVVSIIALVIIMSMLRRAEPRVIETIKTEQNP